MPFTNRNPSCDETAMAIQPGADEISLANVRNLENFYMNIPKHYKLSEGLTAIAGTQPKLAVIAISGGVWKCAAVSVRPEIILTNWLVFEVKLPGHKTRTRHFVGQNITDNEGRASSAIRTFDAAARSGTTESGRVYQLQGRTGLTGDGEYTWGRWKSINLVTDVVDVTAEVKISMEQK